MSSEDEDMECDLPEVVAPKTTQLSPLTPIKYMHSNQQFHKWNKSNGNRPISEDVLLDYFANVALKSKPTTLFAMYSMLKATFRSIDKIDISSYSRLSEYLKEKNSGYKPVKSKVFSDEEIYKFIVEAPDYRWLDVKVVCAFVVNGEYKNLLTVMTEHVKRYDDLFLVTIPQKGATSQYTFPITGIFVDLMQQYIDLRPESAPTNRFFLNYHREKCTTQPIGKNNFNSMARRIAEYLKLSDVERYSRYSFRRKPGVPFNPNPSSANNTAGEKITERVEFDHRTRPMKKSSFSYTRSPVCDPVISSSTSSNINVNRIDAGHTCTFSCGQVQCALDENEERVQHAFDVMKPSEYTITDVTPAVYPCEPACRWIVAYTHNHDAVDSFNADEAFESITRSIPYNVRIDQKYIRGTTSQKSAAYVVVYGVNCRCHKETVENDVFGFTVNEVKFEI